MTSLVLPPARRVISPAKAPATTPPAFEGVWTATDRALDTPDLFPLPSGTAPEDVCVDADGRLVAGAADGAIWRWRAGAEPADVPERIAETGGRPLGIEVDPTDGSLIICDGYRGLLRLRPDGTLVELATTAAGTPINVCNNATVARDGTVYFTDSSSRYPLWAWKRDLLEHRPNGRLLAWRPGGAVDVIATELYFPNGVALTPDESAVMLVETTTHRLLRVPVTGGSPVELLDLAAFPDNMSAVGDGTYWIALPSPRVPMIEKLLPHPGIRRLAALLPDALQPQPLRYSLMALVDTAGTVLRTVHGPAGRYCLATGVRQDGDHVWLGSLAERAVARVPLGS